MPREAVEAWIARKKLTSGHSLFPSRIDRSPHISTRQYARVVKSRVARTGLVPGDYGIHSLRRSKATLIYKRTKNLRAVQLLPGHTRLEARCNTSTLNSMMLWRSRSRPRFNPVELEEGVAQTTAHAYALRLSLAQCHLPNHTSSPMSNGCADTFGNASAFVPSRVDPDQSGATLGVLELFLVEQRAVGNPHTREVRR
jgi:hypothetical protein